MQTMFSGLRSRCWMYMEERYRQLEIWKTKNIVKYSFF